MALPLLALLASSGCSTSSSARTGALNVRKDCSAYAGQAGQTCTITSSNLAAIKVGSTITYASAAVGANLDTDIILAPPAPATDHATGHCALNLGTGVGTCTLSGGTGEFTFLSTSVAVSNVGGPIFAWDGTYRYSH